MFRVLAIDPGRDSGWAFWEGQKLVACGLGRATSQRAAPDLILVEVPCVYPDRKTPPADLVVLAMNAGRHVERMRTIEQIRDPGAIPPPAFGVFPRTWKGTIDGDVMVRRIQGAIGVANHCTAVEAMASVPGGKRHNVWDAVGLGHWAVNVVETGAKLGKDPLTSVRHMVDYTFPDL